MDKGFILQEIKRTAADNGGNPLGYARFRAETGIKQYEWGKFWPSWGDALVEAGFVPNQLNIAYDKTDLLRLYATLARELTKLPANSDLRVKSHADPSFPSAKTFAARLGSKAELIKHLADFCRSESNDFDDVLGLCEKYSPTVTASDGNSRSGKDTVCGYVYLIKSGRFYKVGKTIAAGRRERELAIQLPEKAKTVHVISTDDPNGIEAYWHNRFQAKRLNGEWFNLDQTDVAAFKRRKFM